MGPGLVDLRSDTVTRPTPDMRRAMAEAEVGDDVYGEDPTVNALEEVFAQRVGKEAALFVPSGTMGNQLALRLLAPPATTVVVGRRQHLVIYEDAAGGRNAGVQFHTVDDSDGTVRSEDVAWAVEAAAHHQPRPSLVCVENTHMPADGAPWPRERMEALGATAAAAGLAVHLDGARLFNAEVASGTPAADFTRPATTVMCCLSKGLCAPVGSLLAGPADVIAEARVERHRMGGGMRQAGVIAAAGLVALRTMVDRLADDHRRARRLAEAVAERWPGAVAPPETIRTNVVTFAHASPAALLDHLRSEGVLAGTIAPGVVRLVTHNDVDDAGVERVAKALAASP
ncbi:MAG TPA: GntG family PLP-dependent aldolase [Acidimicrobiales bacterium]|nr:GntG family PLP-dependent aldolase [Acidimicrobiales bacterium]